MPEKFFGRFTIHDGTGTPYMTRYWFGRLRLHIFHRGDNDPDPHDHSGDFWTFPLTGYVEEVVQRTYDMHGRGPDVNIYWNHVRPFRLHHRHAEYCHRVLGRFGGYAPWDWDMKWPTVELGRIVTIVWKASERREWGFLKNRDGKWCWAAWRDYVHGVERDRGC